MVDEVAADYKLFSEASLRNRDAILGELRRLLLGDSKLLEVGSGSGQHAVYFSTALPNISWQPSDCGEYFKALCHNLAKPNNINLLPPIYLDVDKFEVELSVDTVFCANVIHIMSLALLPDFFAGASRHLNPTGQLVLYGPYRYQGAYTSASNEKFDRWLRFRDPHSGIRDIEQVIELAGQNDLYLKEDVLMPANNQLLVFSKSEMSEPP
jgi:cyclopropane fatty-acyl-phospholipid synthase-like methyltransferase